MEEDILITVGELRAIGFCASGQRRWFGDHNLDFKRHLSEGTAASTLLATNDGFALRAVETIKERRRGL